VHERPVSSLSAALRKMVELGLVSEQGSPPSSTYTFSHALIQDAAYESLLRKTRQEFHDRIAEALLQRFPEIADTKPELVARHHEGAGRIAEATAGWIKAGQQAKQRLALRESEAYLRKTIALLETLPENDPVRLQSEMEAQLALGHALTETLGWASHDVERAFTRARELCERLGNNIGLYEALNGLAATHFLLGELPQAVEDAKPVVQMAIAIGDPIFQITAGNLISYPSYYRADFDGARAYAEQALAHYTVERERAIVMAFHLPASFAVTLIRALCLWCLGYCDQAEAGVREALAIIDALNIRVATTFSMGYMLYERYLRRDTEAIAKLAVEAYDRAEEEAYPYWTSSARIFRGWAQAMKGDVEAGLADMQVGLESYRLTGTGLNTSTFCMMKAEVLSKAGRLDEALASLSTGIDHIAKYDEHLHEPELHRVRGEIHLLQGDTVAAEASFRRAIEIAQKFKAKMFEARAAAPLAELLRDQDRIEEACAMLEPLDESFQEGRDQGDVLQVRNILHSLKTEQNVSSTHTSA
jgi:predicted ATPase